MIRSLTFFTHMIFIKDMSAAHRNTANKKNNGCFITMAVIRISFTSPAPNAPIEKNGNIIAKMIARQANLVSVSSNVIELSNFISPEKRLTISMITRRRLGILCLQISMMIATPSNDTVAISKTTHFHHRL